MTAHDDTDPASGADPTTVDPATADPTAVDSGSGVMRCPTCSHTFGADSQFCPFDGTLLGQGAVEPRRDPLLGAVVDGRYEICALLGEGGMGRVYRVRHVSLNRMFAMKVLRKELATEAELAARFVQEARATASIRHPNVVQITDFGRLTAPSAPGKRAAPGDAVPYFVMELLSGVPLSKILKERGALPPALACPIALKIAGALGAAHDAGVVHRDLKPENVFLVGRAGDDGLPEDLRVVDFGAAKVMGASRRTKAGMVFGTPHYMAPEQASGAPVDHRADIYALGVIMYVALTGRVPFEADTYMGVLTQHMFVQPRPLTDVFPGVDAGQRPDEPSGVNQGPDVPSPEIAALEAVILRALEKKPEARFASMDELASAIRRAWRGADESGSVAPVRVDPPPPVPELPAASWPPAPRSTPPPGPPNPPRWLLAGAGVSLAIVVGFGAWAVIRRSPPDPDTTPTSTRAAPSASTAVPDAPPSAFPTASSPSSAPSELVRRRPPAPATRPRAPASSRPMNSDFEDPWKKSAP